MFGYVVVNKPELKIREMEEYRSYYCGLCKCLKQSCGVKGCLSLSYDLTFLAILLSGLYEPEEITTNKVCMVHPLKRQQMKENALLSYVADMAILLAWYKCRDDFEDERRISRICYAKSIENVVKEMEKKHIRQVNSLHSHMEELVNLEKNKSCNIDCLSGCFGSLLGDVFAIREDEWQASLYRMGFYMGKFVYILDAYDDLEKDWKKNTFNPFVKKCTESGFDDYVKQLLMMSAAEFAKEFEKLPILKNAGILRNIIYSGVWTRYEQIRVQKDKEREKDYEKSV